MPADRFFIAGVHAAGAHVELARDDARKIVTVLRAQTGDRIEVVDSAGVVFDATLAVAGTSVDVTLGEGTARASESSLELVLAQAIPKGQKMDFIVEKTTELGVAAIVPVRTQRVIGDRVGENKRERWQRIAKSAAQQSGRTRIPRIAPVADWSELLATFAQYDRVYLPWELAEPAPLRERFDVELHGARKILVLIGPEGGFSADEVARAAAAGAVPISLGRRILRTETAALVVFTAILYARAEL